MHKIFIDGQHGTTGLRLLQKLKREVNIKIISLNTKDYKNLNRRIEAAHAADVTILCLPESASKEIVSALQNEKNIRIIDCSTAFRTHRNWIYGFEELTKGQDKKIHNAKYLSNPGCYPTGALSLIRPLIDAQLLDPHHFLSIHAVSGYSGGGKQLIAQMEDSNHPEPITSNFFSYALALNHKHNKEIKIHSKLKQQPCFLPNVGNFFQGMIVKIGLSYSMLNKKLSHEDLINIYQQHYAGKSNIIVADLIEIEGTTKLDPTLLINTNLIKIYIFSNPKENTICLCSLLDNLGKGASGAALQNLKLMLS